MLVIKPQGSKGEEHRNSSGHIRGELEDLISKCKFDDEEEEEKRQKAWRYAMGAPAVDDTYLFPGHKRYRGHHERLAHSNTEPGSHPQTRRGRH
jgi:hypothetical protein